MDSKSNIEILRTISSKRRFDVNLCAFAYGLIKNSKPSEQSAMLEEFIKVARRSENSNARRLPVKITESEQKTLIEEYGPYVDDELKELIEADYGEEEFYLKLTRFIFEDEMLVDKKAGIIALYDCLIDRRLPYHHLNLESAVRMDNDHFIDLINAIGNDVIETIDCAMIYDFDQKTERAGVVLDLIESRQSVEERVVMLVKVFQHFENKLFNSFIRNMAIDDETE